MKQTIRSFSLGLLTAGTILLMIYYFVEEPKEKAVKMSVDDMIAEMKEEGYRVITEEQYITLSIDKDQVNKDADKTQVASTKSKSDDNKKKEKDDKKDIESKDKKSKDDSDKKDNKEDKKDKVKTYTLKIDSGMPSSDIGDMLAANDIIDDASKFNKYLEDKDYSLRVQLGEFKVKSDMSFYEIAEAITK